MTRFFITLPDSIKFVLNNLKNTSGGEIVIPKMNSIFIKDLIKAINSEIKIKIVGVRPGEKINEVLYSKDDPVKYMKPVTLLKYILVIKLD